ncbi:hypothetical protein Tco_0273017 [Tanacetum coccineum]
MGDENPICTLGDYSKPSHEGYRNTIELPVRNNVVPLRSDTIRLVQNGCSFHGLRSEDSNQHLKDFLKLLDSLDLDGSIITWEDLTTQYLAQFFPSGRTAKLRNDILMFCDRPQYKRLIAAQHFGLRSLIIDLVVEIIQVHVSNGNRAISFRKIDMPDVKRKISMLNAVWKTG